MQLLTNCLLSLFSLIFLLHLSLSSPSSSSSDGSSDALLHDSFAEKTCRTSLPSSSGFLGSSSDGSSVALLHDSFAEKTCRTSLSSSSGFLGSSSDGSSVALLHDSFAEKTCSIATGLLGPLPTGQDEWMAMEALKSSLGIPNEMKWNGNPCFPMTWEGVKCGLDPNGSSLVILEIDLSKRGLTGYIAEEIKILTNLKSLNLSSNHLTGPIPTDVYSIHLRGGTTNFSDNKGLCGVGLPDTRHCCPLKMMSSNTKALVLFLVLWFVGLAYKYVRILRDQDDPEFTLYGEIVYPQVVIRVMAAAEFFMFEMLRVAIMETVINTPDFDMRLAYYKWFFGVVVVTLYGVVVGSFLLALLIQYVRGSTRSTFKVFVFSAYMASLVQSIHVMRMFYQRPFLMILEMVWMVCTYVFMTFLIRLPLTTDVRVWVHNAVMLVGTVIQPLRWIDYIVLTFFMYKMMSLINIVMAP